MLLISEDLDESWRLSDRIAVIYEGRIAGEFERRADADVDADRAAHDRRAMGRRAAPSGDAALTARPRPLSR